MNEQLLHSFAEYLQYERAASEHTRKAYLNDLKQLDAYLNDYFQLTHFLSVDLRPKHLRAWVFSMAELDRRSIKRKVSAVRSFFRYLKQRGLRNDSLGFDLGIRLGEAKLFQVCSRSTLSKMYERAQSNSSIFIQLRDQILIDLLYGCGLRRAEVVGLHMSNIDLSRRSIRIIGKGKRERQVPLPEEVYGRLIKYLELREVEYPSETATLVLTDRGKPVYSHFIYRRIKFLSSGLGDVSSTHPHALRHSYATTLIDEGADLGSVSDLLGHRSAQTTQIYVHNSLERLKMLHAKAHPRTKAK